MDRDLMEFHRSKYVRFCIIRFDVSLLKIDERNLRYDQIRYLIFISRKNRRMMIKSDHYKYAMNEE